MPKPESEKKTSYAKGRKPHVILTDEMADQFLEHYRETGTFYLAAEMVGSSSSAIKDRMKRDPEFAAAVHEAKEANTDDLIKEAIRRATKGVDEPIIGGEFRDEIVAYKTRFSDSLMTLLLASRREEFRGKDKVDDAGGQTGGVLIVGSRPTSLDDWEAEHGEAAKGNTGRPEAKK